MIVVDTNLLIYAHRSQASHHEAAKAAISKASTDPSGWGITSTSVSEFWSVVTNPSISGRSTRPGEARAFMQALAVAGGQVLSPAPGFTERLMLTAEDLGVVGPRIFDLQIALTALDHGATEIWTTDLRFVAVPGLRSVNPL